MTLRNRAILELDPIEDADGVGVFELDVGLEITEEISRQFIMAQRGQYLSEIYDLGLEALGSGSSGGVGERRAGYHLDGGAGSHDFTLSFECGFKEGRWGDGSSDPNDSEDYTRYDAAGSHPLVAMQVLTYWLSQARTDSGGQARLHIGEWTDGTYGDAVGVFGEPLAVAVEEANLTKAEDDAASAEGTLALRRTATVTDIDATADELVDAVGDVIPDW